MSSSSEILENVVDQFASLPGIGRKTALRFALFLLNQPEEHIDRFTKTLVNLKNIQYCRTCFNISDDQLCSICSAPSRSSTQIMVVESIKDILTVEATGQYFGKYHVLGGVISPLDGIGPADLNIAALLERVGQMEDMEEVIFALPTTMEGDTTAFFLFRKLEQVVPRISNLAKGVAIGDSLEYTDEITLGRSIVNRTPFDTVN